LKLLEIQNLSNEIQTDNSCLILKHAQFAFLLCLFQCFTGFLMILVLLHVNNWDMHRFSIPNSKLKAHPEALALVLQIYCIQPPESQRPVATVRSPRHLGTSCFALTSHLSLD
jgi:hypothetical protein